MKLNYLLAIERWYFNLFHSDLRKKYPQSCQVVSNWETSAWFTFEICKERKEAKFIIPFLHSLMLTKKLISLKWRKERYQYCTKNKVIHIITYTFSIGMTLLSVCLLQDCADAYIQEDNRWHVDFEIIKNKFYNTN